jgi:hypothetical protein
MQAKESRLHILLLNYCRMTSDVAPVILLIKSVTTNVMQDA